ncbi:MAG: hypothetical protein ABMA02_08465 [Saprospiraceae bacterium]
MAKKDKPKSKPKSDTSVPIVHADLHGMNISVNALGQIVKDYNIDDINAFLDKNVKDKKLDNEAG